MNSNTLDYYFKEEDDEEWLSSLTPIAKTPVIITKEKYTELENEYFKLVMQTPEWKNIVFTINTFLISHMQQQDDNIALLHPDFQFKVAVEQMENAVKKMKEIQENFKTYMKHCSNNNI
jgi:hypothetical protein